MRPIFTIHAGEYLVGRHLEQTFRGCRVWVPSKDTGIDLLVSDEECKRTVSLQVKYGRDFVDSLTPPQITQNSFFTVSHKKLAKSPADYWVIVLDSFSSKKRRPPRFLVMTPEELLKRIKAYHKPCEDYLLYFSVVNEEKCWDLRGVKSAELRSALEEVVSPDCRDYSRFLDDKLSRIGGALKLP